MNMSTLSGAGDTPSISAEEFVKRLDEILDLVSKEGISIMIESEGRSCLLTPCCLATAAGEDEER